MNKIVKTLKEAIQLAFFDHKNDTAAKPQENQHNAHIHQRIYGFDQILPGCQRKDSEHFQQHEEEGKAQIGLEFFHIRISLIGSRVGKLIGIPYHRGQ